MNRTKRNAQDVVKGNCKTLLKVVRCCKDGVRDVNFFLTAPQGTYKPQKILPAYGFFFFLECLECSIFGVSLFFSYCEWVPVHSNQMSNSAWAVSLSLMSLSILSLHSAPVCSCISFHMDFYRFSQIIIILLLAIIIFLKLECFYQL